MSLHEVTRHQMHCQINISLLVFSNRTEHFRGSEKHRCRYSSWISFFESLHSFLANKSSAQVEVEAHQTPQTVTLDFTRWDLFKWCDGKQRGQVTAAVLQWQWEKVTNYFNSSTLFKYNFKVFSWRQIFYFNFTTSDKPNTDSGNQKNAYNLIR